MRHVAFVRGTGWGAYSKLLFWTDAGNLLGLLPPGAPGARAHPPPANSSGSNSSAADSYRLLVFPADDYPNQWAGEVAVADGEWYDAHVTVAAGGHVTVAVGGQQWTRRMGVDFRSDRNGPVAAQREGGREGGRDRASRGQE